ncbi:MAG: LytTR family DNA-binding domain-containing protein [Bacteroides sp.]|nr:LytTR family DNA-binding domain-containing protein [Bacteroides sp.]
MIKAVIIDDEPAMVEVNSRLLAEYFPDIQMAGSASSVESGIALIRKQNPDLVLLDIELKHEKGFQILQSLKPYHFKVVFITGHDSFAIKAIKFSALDYILKPVNESEFQQSIQNAVELIESKANSQSQADVLMDSFKRERQAKKLVLRTSDSLHVINVADIYFCKSDNSYTTFYFRRNEEIVVSKSLKDYENLLTEFDFFRAHQSYLVNLNHISKVSKTDGGFIVMKNKKQVPVSSRQMKNLLGLLEKL